MDQKCPSCDRPYGKIHRCYYCNPTHRRTGEMRVCKQCGTEFYAQRNQIADTARNSATYCSRACLYAGRPPRPAMTEVKTVHSAGYLLTYAPDHPRATGGRVFDHILVAEAMLGRPLAPGEFVHHKDHNRQNNAPENLQIVSNSEHGHLHATERAPDVIARRPTIACVECGTEFHVKPYQAVSTDPQSRRKYCSLACRHAAWGRQMKARRAAKRAPPPKE